jgi:acetyltransferase-like isoleucine patch superfamily enzyme
VTSNIPEYSIAVGIPAKIIKSFDFDKEKWINL